MITKKTIIEGKALTQVFSSPLAFLHSVFDTAPVEAKPISRYTSEYREYRKKIVAEGRLTQWGAIQPIREKARR